MRHRTDLKAVSDDKLLESLPRLVEQWRRHEAERVALMAEARDRGLIPSGDEESAAERRKTDS